MVLLTVAVLFKMSDYKDQDRMGLGLEEYWDGVDGPAERQV